MQIYNLSVVLYGVIYVYSFFRLYHNSFILGSNNAYFLYFLSYCIYYVTVLMMIDRAVDGFVTWPSKT